VFLQGFQALNSFVTFTQAQSDVFKVQSVQQM